MSFKLEYKRVMDLLPLPEGMSEKIDLSATGIKKFFSEIESSRFTGFVTFSSQELLSRGFFIIYKGRCIGCTFSSAVKSFQESVQESIALALADIKAGGALVINKCPMPPQVVLPLSAAYQGLSEDIKSSIPEKSSLSDTIAWFKKNNNTGNIVITSELGNCYIFFHEGAYTGTFNPEAKEIILDENAAFSFLEHSKKTEIQPIFLAKSMMEKESNFGHDLASLLD